VSDLSKIIQGRTVVQNVSFNILRGEVFGFLGPNGAGKTTTIRMLVGLIKPSAGSVRINGFDLQRNFTEAIRHVGCIVENPEMYAYLSGRDNLEHFAGMIGDPAWQRIEDLVRLVGLEQRINDKVKTYSLGMRQRLGIAQALLGDPKLLILDEPTNGLDPAGIRELRAFIRKLATEEGISVFVSSHLLSEVELLCDRVAIIHQGRMVKVDTVERLIPQTERQMEWKVDKPAQARAILSRIPSVKNMDAADASQADSLHNRDHFAIILCQMDDAAIGETTRQFVEAGITVVGIRNVAPSLEELFLQLTGGGTTDGSLAPAHPQ